MRVRELAFPSAFFSASMLPTGNIIREVMRLADGGFFITQWFQHLVDASIWWWLLALTVAAGAALLFGFLVLWRQRWIIEVHQEGLRSWVQSLGMNWRNVPLLSWQQARLFACYHKPGPWGARL